MLCQRSVWRFSALFLCLCVGFANACASSSGSSSASSSSTAQAPPRRNEAADNATAEVPTAQVAVPDVRVKGAVALTAPPSDLAAAVKLELVTDDTKEATGLVAAAEPPGRLFVLEKRGVIRVLKSGKFNAQPFLDISSKVKLDNRDNGEQGLLGLAFHPDFAKNGRFYINYTSTDGGATQVEERKVGRNKDKADPKSVKTLLQVAQPYSNHNAGDMAFGPDGKLYIGLGDGGAGGDPHGHGQNAETLLGSLIRIDVNTPAAKPELVAIGLRNPWRISFDSKTGDLYIADVGQNKYEYVHLLTAHQLQNVAAPYNLGWNVMEGFHCFKDKDCDPSPFQPPIIEYPRAEGCSITGGYVYRGTALPQGLQGQYFYSDYCTALVRSLAREAGKTVNSWDWKAAVDPEARLARIASFGQDQAGELYLVTHEGPIYKFVPAAK